METRMSLYKVRFDRANDKLVEIEELKKEGKRAAKAKTAFITFSTEQGFIRAMNLYPQLGLLHRLMMPTGKRMANAKFYRPIVRKAPEPSELIWENLGISPLNHFIRKSITALLTLLLLAVSFVLISQAKSESEKANLKYPPADCTGVQVIPNLNATFMAMNINQTSYLYPTDVEKDVFWDFYEEPIGNTGRLECFCKALLINPDYSLEGMNAFMFNNPETEEEDPMCKSWFETYLKIQALKIGAIMAVVVTNVLLKEILKHMIMIEAPSDQTTLTSSLTLKVSKREMSKSTIWLNILFHSMQCNTIQCNEQIFLASFVNTAMLTLLINGNINYLYAEEGGEGWSGMGLLGGSHQDLDVKWYKEIGVPIIVTMIINMLSPHVAAFIGWIMLRVKQCRDRGCACAFNGNTKQVTQGALEDLFTGPQFIMYLRLSTLLNSLFVCLMFSGGMPIMIPICFATVWSYYLVDKVLLLRFYR